MRRMTKSQITEMRQEMYRKALASLDKEREGVLESRADLPDHQQPLDASYWNQKYQQIHSFYRDVAPRN
jgi:hypothetical protein